MPITQFFDPFGIQLEDRNTESQINARNTNTALNLFSMQQQMDEMKRNKEYLRRTQNPTPVGPSGQPGQQGQPKPQPSASDMILSEISGIDQKIAIASNLGLNSKVDQLSKIRDAALGRYSLARDREGLAQDRQEKLIKERVGAVSRFASGANEILMDDTVKDKPGALKELEDSIRRENPEAYKVLSQGQPKINWDDPRTWNRMQALEAQAIDPAKRRELALSERRADEQKRRDDLRERQVDAMIAKMREGGTSERLPVGTRWVDPKDHSKGAVKIKIEGDEKVVNSAQKELSSDPTYKNYDRYQQAYDVAKTLAAKIATKGYQNVTAADVQQLRAHYQNVIDDFRTRAGGKYNTQEFAKLNGAIQGMDKWIESIGRGTPGASESVARQVIGVVQDEYLTRTKQVVLNGLKAAANVERRGGDPNSLRLRGNVNALVQSGQAAIKTDDEGVKWIGIKDGDAIRKFKLPEDAF